METYCILLLIGFCIMLKVNFVVKLCWSFNFVASSLLFTEVKGFLINFYCENWFDFNCSRSQLDQWFLVIYVFDLPCEVRLVWCLSWCKFTKTPLVICIVDPKNPFLVPTIRFSDLGVEDANDFEWDDWSVYSWFRR